MDVRTQCLGLLMRGPASGYDLKKRVEEGPFCHFLQASFASIYPALSRLTREGLVTVTTQAQANRPDKKVYEITENGRQAFLNTIKGPLEEDSFRSPWFVAMYFADLLPPERLRSLIAMRVERCSALLSKIDQDAAETRGAAFVADMGAHLLRSELDFLRTYGGSFASGPSNVKTRKHAVAVSAAIAEPIEI
jgi:PadR family transcriptional regulator, regulatory protein AphA